MTRPLPRLYRTCDLEVEVENWLEEKEEVEVEILGLTCDLRVRQVEDEGNGGGSACGGGNSGG